ERRLEAATNRPARSCRRIRDDLWRQTGTATAAVAGRPHIVVLPGNTTGGIGEGARRDETSETATQARIPRCRYGENVASAGIDLDQCKRNRKSATRARL